MASQGQQKGLAAGGKERGSEIVSRLWRHQESSSHRQTSQDHREGKMVPHRSKERYPQIQTDNPTGLVAQSALSPGNPAPLHPVRTSMGALHRRRRGEAESSGGWRCSSTQKKTGAEKATATPRGVSCRDRSPLLRCEVNPPAGSGHPRSEGSRECRRVLVRAGWVRLGRSEAVRPVGNPGRR